MGRRELIAGKNFSGRSELLRTRLKHRQSASFFVGPYAEAALSGLSTTVIDEIAIYASSEPLQRDIFSPLDLSAYGGRKPQTLSGGEQVLLALHCFSRSAFASLAIDTALEQLDNAHRAAALAFLDKAGEIIIIDNRLAEPPSGWMCTTLAITTPDFVCDPAELAAALAPCAAPVIAIRSLNFHYRRGTDVFRDVTVILEPGHAYRLSGPNGAGKTTLLKILVGVLAPSAGHILLGGTNYTPWRSGNIALALATQNPDHQWCGATLQEDITRRRAGLKAHHLGCPANEQLAANAKKLGSATLEQHLYELPLAARKRLSWLWPLSGVMPWVMLDEPTIGQDSDTRHQLATALAWLCTLGYGVVFVTHDDDFAQRIPHGRLSITDKTIKTDPPTS